MGLLPVQISYFGRPPERKPPLDFKPPPPQLRVEVMTLHFPLATLRGVFRQLLWRNANINPSASPLLARSWAHGPRAPMQAPSVVWTRGAKRQSKKMLAELPQGIIALEPLPYEQYPKYPPVIEQARANMNKLPNNVLLTRVGSFYEVRYSLVGAHNNGLIIIIII